MKRLLRQSIHWHPARPAWGAAMVAGFGCALPLLLGLFIWRGWAIGRLAGLGLLTLYVVYLVQLFH